MALNMFNAEQAYALLSSGSFGSYTVTALDAEIYSDSSDKISASISGLEPYGVRNITLKSLAVGRSAAVPPGM